MVHEFKLPDVGEGVAEGELVEWLVEVGDTVSEDQPVAEVETDKALTVDHRVIDGAKAARFAGRLGELLENPMLLLLY